MGMSYASTAKHRKVRDWLQIGHAGTLDPMATGLLVICTGKGTKAIEGFVAMEKAYSGTLRLGQATPSYDAETDVSEEHPWEHITGASSGSLHPGSAGLLCDMLRELSGSTTESVWIYLLPGHAMLQLLAFLK